MPSSLRTSVVHASLVCSRPQQHFLVSLEERAHHALPVGSAAATAELAAQVSAALDASPTPPRPFAAHPLDDGDAASRTSVLHRAAAGTQRRSSAAAPQSIKDGHGLLPSRRHGGGPRQSDSDSAGGRAILALASYA